LNPCLGRSSPWSGQDDDLLGRLVEALPWPRLRHEVVVADARPDPVIASSRVDRQVHTRLNRQGFIDQKERPLHQVIALPVGVQAQFRLVPFPLQEGIVGLEDLPGVGAGSQHTQGVLLRLFRISKGIHKLLRRVSQ